MRPVCSDFAKPLDDARVLHYRKQRRADHYDLVVGDGVGTCVVGTFVGVDVGAGVLVGVGTSVGVRLGVGLGLTVAVGAVLGLGLGVEVRFWLGAAVAVKVAVGL